MRYLIFLILFSFCSTSLFSQETVDTSTITIRSCFGESRVIRNNHLENLRDTIGGKELKISSRRPVINIENFKPTVVALISCGNHRPFINPFRFENVNQMANTVAGVLSLDGETPSILGARREGTAYYINEVRVLEGFLPQSIEN